MTSLMMHMPHIIAVVAFLVACGAPAWRSTALIILGTSLFNILLGGVFEAVGRLQDTLGVANPYLYITAGAIDLLTAFFLLAFGSKGKYSIAGILAVFTLVNVGLLVEILNGAGLVYQYYGEMIFALNCIQLLLFSGGIHELLRSAYLGSYFGFNSGRGRGYRARQKILEDGQ